jgi:3D (Asp-Asp-Asp) domain-containing protein
MYSRIKQIRETAVLLLFLLLLHAFGCCLRYEGTGTNKCISRGISAVENISETGRYSGDNGGINEEFKTTEPAAGTEKTAPVKAAGTAAGKTRETIVLAARGLDKPKKEMRLQATAYTHTGNPTFTGVYPQVGTIAVDPQVIPLGTRMWVEGYGYGIAQDTGGLIKGNIIDLFMDTEAECWQWGRRFVKVYLFE